MTLQVPVRTSAVPDTGLYGAWPPPATTGPSAVVTAIPYFLWANRAAGPMRVWIPLSPSPR